MKNERNPDSGKFIKPNGYRDIGWQMTMKNEDFRKCVESIPQHVTREFDNSLFKYRCTDVITICDECKMIWHTDMSD